MKYKTRIAARMMSDLKRLEHQISRLSKQSQSERVAFLKGSALEKHMCAIMIERDFRNEPFFDTLRYWEGIAEHYCGADPYSDKCMKCDLREMLGMDSERKSNIQNKQKNR